MYKLVAQPLLWLSMLALTSFAATDPSTQSSTSPISYRRVIKTDPPLRMHVVTVDLTSPDVELRVERGGPDPDGDGPWKTTLATVRDIATREHLAVAVNGNFFQSKDARELFGRRNPYYPGNWARPVGWAMTDGDAWGTIDGGECSVVVYDDQRRVTIGKYKPNLPDGARHVVSGAEMVLTDGQVTGTAPDVAPRACIGIDRDGKRLTLLACDGRRADWSVGLTGAQLGQVMLELGCWRALNLDGGGSATMVMRDATSETGEAKLVNRPSDGHDLPISMSFERSVAVAFGVRLRERAK